ncbi:hypothetical protein [Jeotgalibacillus campisalis]|uniref:Uncharacterized protein n=1 Tax=Jeotgalibacillus campisalis TaxID=220754 RepID=A0A0C2S3W7_9BACL|nr:hypothetical protein [Jeotgalibacillus campisalis]KIL48679.1 hypothetical protein KR50_12640 [Jeotgalibacillus campisalis]
MSKNQEYQDNIEQRCLDFVKNDMNEKDCFGLSNNQYVELKNWLNESKLNFNNNKFPDFVFNDGFIEHFSVTSSLENRKGAKQKRESTVFKKNSENNFFSNLDNIEEDILLSRSHGRLFEEHTYFNIVNSIKKNWVKHIESYDKNISTSKHGIFLIEYIDINIQTAVARENEPAEIFETYRISVDKHLLNWIYTYKEKIDNLIFVNLLLPSIEVIRIDNIPELIVGISNVIYAPTLGMETHKYVGFKIMKDNI